MYAVIQRSNSGTSYAYGTFETKAEATSWAAEHMISRACTWEIVTFMRKELHII